VAEIVLMWLILFWGPEIKVIWLCKVQML